MAGQGPAPKVHRQRAQAPLRGEWVELPAVLNRYILPELPKRRKGTGTWSARTRKAWEAWRSDPVTSQYGISDVTVAVDLVFLYEEMARGKLSLLGEIRQIQDRLGLNPKGKRDLRWRIPTPAKVETLPKRTRRLQAVE